MIFLSSRNYLKNVEIFKNFKENQNVQDPIMDQLLQHQSDILETLKPRLRLIAWVSTHSQALSHDSGRLQNQTFGAKIDVFSS